MRPASSEPALWAGCILLLIARLHPAAAQYVSMQSMEFSPSDMYPFITLVMNQQKGPLCTGSLIGKQAVLTAASCVTGKTNPRPEVVLVGVSNVFLDPFRRKGQYEILWVDRVVVHPGFHAKTPQKNNLALVLLRRPSKTIRPVALPRASYPYPAKGAALTALGFGSRSGDGYWPQAHDDTLTLLPQAECNGLQTAYGPPPGKLLTQACTALSHAFRSCAAGNVGAPLVAPDAGPNGSALQLALMTGGFSCSTDPTVASASSPALYTWLPYYAAWLAQQLAKAGAR